MKKTLCTRGLDAIRVRGTRSAPRRVIGKTGEKYLVMRVNNPRGLIEHEKGKGIAWATMTFVPELTVDRMYEKIKGQMEQQFREKGSEVAIDIVESPPTGVSSDMKDKSDLKGGILIGVLLAALGYGGVKLATRRW